MKRIKKLYEFQAVLLKMAFWIWITETVVFLLIEGWHWKATNPIEIRLDQMVSALFTIWFILLIRLVLVFFEELIKQSENED